MKHIILNKLIFQYKLFKLKYKDVSILKNQDKISKLKNKKINKLILANQKKENVFNIDNIIKYLYDSLDLYEEDFKEEGWTYDENIGYMISENNDILKKYFNNCNNSQIPFYIFYKL